GWGGGKHWLDRLYTEEGLALRRKRPWRHATAVHRERRRPAQVRNEIWSMDFVADQLADGRRFRALTVIDLFTRECLAIDVGHGLTGRDVGATLERLRFERGLPQRIYCDNGTEFVSTAMDLWAYTHGVMLDFSRRGKPTDNAAIESFNGRFREECLNIHWFASLEDAQEKIDAFRSDYNENHPHRALKGLRLSGIRSGSDGNRRGLTLIVDHKTRAPHEAKSSTSTRSSFWGQVLYAWTFLPVWSFLLGALRTLRRSSSLSLPHKASPCSARAAIGPLVPARLDPGPAASPG